MGDHKADGFSYLFWGAKDIQHMYSYPPKTTELSWLLLVLPPINKTH